MKEPAEQQKARAITEALNKGYFHHGYPLARTEARQIGLKVADPDLDLENLMWAVWLDIEAEMKCRIPFDPLVELANSDASGALLAPAQQLNMPANLPPLILQHLLPGLLNTLSSTEVPLTNYEIITAVMESERVCSRNVVRGKILAARLPDLQVAANLVPTHTGWEECELHTTGTP